MIQRDGWSDLLCASFEELIMKTILRIMINVVVIISILLIWGVDYKNITFIRFMIGWVLPMVLYDNRDRIVHFIVGTKAKLE